MRRRCRNTGGMPASGAVLLVLGASLILAGCRGVPLAREDRIGDILRDPAAYSNQEVHVRGEVVSLFSLPVLPSTAYEVQDGTGAIWVLTGRDPPARGSRVRVTGVVRHGAIINDQAIATAPEERQR